MVILGIKTISQNAINDDISKALTWGNGPEELWDWSRWDKETYGDSKYFTPVIILAALVSASYSGQWSYAGWSDINYCMGEISNPHVNYPISAIISLSLTTVLYTGIITSFYAVLTHTEVICGIKATASVFAERALFGNDTEPNYYVRGFVALAVSMANAGVLHSSLFAGSRLFQAGYKFNHMPPVIGGLHKEHKTPIPALFLLCFISVIYCVTPLFLEDPIAFLVNATCFIYFFSIAACIMLLIIWRHKDRPNVGSIIDKKPQRSSQITTPLQESEKLLEPETNLVRPSFDKVFILPLWIHYLYSIINILISVYNFYADFRASIIGTLVILIGVPIYYLFINGKSKYDPNDNVIPNKGGTFRRRIFNTLSCDFEASE